MALGNWGAPEAVPALVQALSDPEPLVRGHAAWALGRIGTAEARAALAARRSVEGAAYVQEEIWAALAAGPEVVGLQPTQSKLGTAPES